MRQVITALSIVLLAGLLVQTPARGDVIPEGYHYVDRQVRITNLDAHPDVVLVAYVIGPMIDPYEAFVVEQDVTLEKGYKFNSLRLFALQRTAFDNAGGLAGIDFEAIAATIDPAEIVDPGGFLVEDRNPLVTEEMYYRIQSTGAASVTLALHRRVLGYSDNTPDRVEDF